MSKSRLLSWIALVLVACGRTVPVFHANDITGSQVGGEFRLQDGAGRWHQPQDFAGKVLVVFFGYTRCPDVCPTTLARLAEAKRLLGDDGRRLQVVFVTLDPERDTPQQLSAFVRWFDPSFIGLWADAPTISATAQTFKVFYQRHDEGSAMGYSIDHFAGGYAFDPAGRIRLLIPQEENAQQVADDARLLLAGK